MCHTVFVCSEVAGLLLIDPAVETLFDGGQSDKSREDKSHSQSKDQTQTQGSAWSEYWYTRVLPPMQSVQVSASLGFNRVGLMLGLMSPVEEPELKRLLPEEAITIKVKSTGYFEGLKEKSILVYNNFQHVSDCLQYVNIASYLKSKTVASKGLDRRHCQLTTHSKPL